MGLLNPASLFYLLSVAVLVAIYFRARSRPTLEVSSLLLFEEQAAPVARARRLHTDLLFWLELMVLAALSLAIAGLYVRAPQPPEHIRRHALIFDSAAAMGAREGAHPRIELARRQALRMVAAAPAGDQFSVIAYALESEVVRAPSGDRNAVRAAIASLQPLAVPVRPAALSAALMRAREADDIELFSDRLPAGALPPGLGDRLHFHQVGSTDDNLALVSLDPGQLGSSRGHLMVRNFSAEPRGRPSDPDAAAARPGGAELRTDNLGRPGSRPHRDSRRAGGRQSALGLPARGPCDQRAADFSRPRGARRPGAGAVGGR